MNLMYGGPLHPGHCDEFESGLLALAKLKNGEKRASKDFSAIGSFVFVKLGTGPLEAFWTRSAAAAALAEGMAGAWLALPCGVKSAAFGFNMPFPAFGLPLASSECAD